MKKRLWSICLTVIMLFTMIPAGAFAGDGSGTADIPESVELSSVLGQTPEVESSSIYSVSADVTVYSISADVTVYRLDKTVSGSDIKAAAADATVTFYGTDGTYSDEEAGSVSLTEGDNTTVYAKVVSAGQDCEARYALRLKATRPREITGFEAVTLSAGAAGSAKYANEAAVIAALPSVVRGTYSGGVADIAVGAWTASGTAIDLNKEGSYTFTATAAAGEGYTFAAGLNTAVTATVTVSGLPTVTSVAVTAYSSKDYTTAASAATPSAPLYLKAVVAGDNDPSQEVTWSISGNVNSTGTYITTDGALYVASDETAESLTVTAISVADDTKFGTATVYPATLTGFTVTPVSSTLSMGETTKFTISGLTFYNSYYAKTEQKKLIWTISGANSTATKLKYSSLDYTRTTQVLTVGADESASELTITVTSAADASRTASATVLIKLFPDSALNDALAALMKKEDGYQVTKDDLLTFTELDLSQKGIVSISGLGNAVNLTKLNLSGNAIAANTYTALSAMKKLKELDLSYCSMAKTTDKGSFPTELSSALYNNLNNLESLNIAGNNLRYLPLGMTFPSLKSYNASDNRVYFLHVSMFGRSFSAIDSQYMPKLETVDVSQNYLDFGKNSDSWQDVNWVKSHTTDAQKNLSELDSVKLGQTAYSFDTKTKTADLGSILGSSVTLKFVSNANSTMVSTDSGKRYYATYNADSSDQPEIIVPIQAGENSITVLSTHENGDASAYTVKCNGIGVKTGTAGITDGNLQSRICSLLKKDASTYEVSKEDMESFTALKLDGAGIYNASGLEYAVNLTSLSLARNKLTALPDLSSLTKLTSLNLSVNNFEKVPDCINNLTGLTYLDLDGNSIEALSGDIDKLTNLETLNLGTNKLNTAADLSSLKALTRLNVANNNLQTLPDISQATGLKTLDISYNPISEIPETVFSLTNLTGLDFDACRITEIPAAFAKLTQLTAINAKSNRIAAVAPEVGKMTSIRTLNLEGNRINTLPELNEMTALTTINLKGNAFSEVPEAVWQVKTLEDLTLSANDISTISQDIKNLIALKTITLESCEFTEFPKALLSLSGLTKIDISGNKMEKIEENWSELTNLSTLDLSENRLLAYPRGLSALASLKSLDLHINHFTSLTYDEISDCPTGLSNLVLESFVDFDANETAAAALTKLTSEHAAGVKVDYYTPLPQASVLVFKTSEEDLLIEPAPLVYSYNCSLSVPKGTKEITVTPAAAWADTEITCGTQTVKSGEPLTVSGLVPGENTVLLTSENPADSHKLSYTLTIYVKASDGEVVFPTEGHTYKVGINLLQMTSDDKSMSASYLSNTATVEAEDGKLYAYFETSSSNIFYDIKYRAKDNQWTPTTVMKHDETTKTYTHKIEVQNLDDAVELTGYVVPMGYSPQFRMVFSKNTLVDLTTGGVVDTPDLVSISLDTTNAKTEYTIGDSLDLRGLIVNGTYDNSSVNSLTITGANVTGFDSSKAAESQTLTVTVDGKTATYTISIKEKEIDPGDLKDGEYYIPVRLWHATSDQASMGDAALVKTAKLVVKDGKGTLHLSFGSLTVEAFNMTGYLANLKLATNLQFNSLGGIESATLTDATVISSYDDVWDTFNHPDTGSDSNLKGKAYPKEITIPVALGEEYTYAQVYVPVMEAISTGSGTQYARVRLDYSGLIAEEPDTKDGNYNIPVRLWHATGDQPSMGDAALIKTAELVVKDGKGTLHLSFGSLTVEALKMTGYLANLKLATNLQFNSLGGIESATLTDATLISSYSGVWDTFNHPDTGSDTDLRGKAYPKEITIPVELGEEYTYVQVYVPVMEALSAGSGTQYARVRLDYSGLVPAGQPDPNKEPVKEFTAGNDGVAGITPDDLLTVTDKTQNVGVNFGDVSVSIPVQYLNDYFSQYGSAGAALQFKKTASDEGTKASVLQIMADGTALVGAIELNLNLGDQAIKDLGGKVKVTVSLTESQVSALNAAKSKTLYYYNPNTKKLEDMNGTFDLTAKTVTFLTDHFSTYVVAGSTGGNNNSGDNGGGSGGSGEGTPTVNGLVEGKTYSIEVDALQETSKSKSMADQFFTESAQIRAKDGEIKVTVYMYGTKSSPQLSSGIKMSMLKSVEYLKDGNWLDAIKKLDKDEDSLRLEMTVKSLEPLKMRVYVPEGMGETRQIFRLDFKEDTLSEGSVDFGSGAPPVDGDYVITAKAGDGGTISPSGKVGVNDKENKTFTMKADDGYVIEQVLVDGVSKGAISTYTFEKVAADHTIRVSFKTLGKASEKFTDIKGHWAEKAIRFAADKGILSGTAEGIFSPDAEMSRGMFVTVLGRLHGVDASKYTKSSFEDVPAGKYYSPYIAWAVENGLANGIGAGKFAPDRQITREQAAAIFAAYQKLAGNKQTSAAAITTGSAVTATGSAVTAAENVKKTTAGSINVTKGVLPDGNYEVEAVARMESKDDLSMADQFMTEKAFLTVKDGKMNLSMTWYGTEFITMDMLKELKYQKADGSFTDVSRTLAADSKNMKINLEIKDVAAPVIMQVYVPAGMGEMRPKFRLMLDTKTLKAISETNAAPKLESGGATDYDLGFADQGNISTWAKDGVRAMKDAGLFKGDANNNFNPKKSITRAEAAMLLARSLGFKE